MQKIYLWKQKYYKCLSEKDNTDSWSLTSLNKITSSHTRSKTNFKIFRLFALLIILSNSVSADKIEITAISGSGAKDDPAIYNSIPNKLSDKEWDEAAVRRVLHAFAYGGSCLDSQIVEWANMNPGAAIVQMLGMWTTHSKLSRAYDGGNINIPAKNASLSILSNYFASGNFAADPEKFNQDVRYGNSVGYTWINAVKLRGLNPFRQKIVLFETNYHLAISLQKNVNPKQMLHYYDTIANNLASGKPYHQILGEAALSAGVATQYNHRKNIFENGAFKGNEDFAREYHQLFFGILGTGVNGNCKFGDSSCSGNPESFDDHENKTIRQTAEALTDIQVEGKNRDFLPVVPIFGTNKHYTGKVSIYGEEYAGNNAKERIFAISSKSIRHPESLKFLPLKIIGGLADDNLDPLNPVEGCDKKCSSFISKKIENIRQLWSKSIDSNGEINLIEFIRKYAISKEFHNPSRIKFLNSVDRIMLLSNVLAINNQEVKEEVIPTFRKLYQENVIPFRPEHDVFGGQSGLEASNTNAVFVNQFNSSKNQRFGNTGYYDGKKVVPVKNFKFLLKVELKKTSDGYNVKDVAEFFWKRITGDQQLQFFTDSARSQVYSLLANGNDYLVYNNEECRTRIHKCTDNTILTTSPSISDLDSKNDNIRNLRDSAIFRDSSDEKTLDTDNERVGFAIDFIAATPFLFVQTGE
ncbi:MAG: DUF1800 family protein [Leptospiraceae bacterium]|nr:DUF1800 family protein [Leptospiraceae bacterium]